MEGGIDSLGDSKAHEACVFAIAAAAKKCEKILGKLPKWAETTKMLTEKAGVKDFGALQYLANVCNSNSLKSVRILLLIASQMSAGPATADKLHDALNRARDAQVDVMQKRANELMKARQNTEAPRPQVEHFLDQARPRIEALRKKFTDPNEPALRYVIANLLVPYETVITKLVDSHNQTHPNSKMTVETINERLGEMTGAPVHLRDVRESGSLAEHSPNYAERMIEIMQSKECQEFASVVGGTKIMFDYELVTMNQSEREAVGKKLMEQQDPWGEDDVAKLFADALETFKDTDNLRTVMSLVEPETLNLPSSSAADPLESVELAHEREERLKKARTFAEANALFS